MIRLLEIFLTVSCYLAVPISLIVIKQPIKKNTIKWVALINAIIVFIGYSVLHFFTDGEPANSNAMLLWGIISYWLLKKFAAIKEIVKITDSNTKQKIKPIPLVESDQNVNDDLFSFIVGLFLDTYFKADDIIDSNILGGNLPDNEKIKSYFLIEFHILLYCSFSSIIGKKGDGLSPEKLIQTLTAPIIAHCESLWGERYESPTNSLHKERSEDYQKIFFNHYCPIDFLEVAENSPENKIARAFSLYSDYIVFYYCTNQIACIEDFSPVPLFDLLEYAPLRILCAELSHIYSNYIDALCKKLN